MLQYSHHPKKKPRLHWQSNPVSPTPTTTNLLSAFADLPVLGNSHKWNHTLCGPLWRASLTEYEVFKVPPSGHICQQTLRLMAKICMPVTYHWT